MSSTTRAGMVLMTVLALSAPTHGQPPSYSFRAAGSPFSRVPVLNASFSADASTTFRATRPDGNTEEHTLTARYYRDSLGRVRAELDTAWGRYVILDVRGGPWPGMRDVQYTDGSWGPGGTYVLDPIRRIYRSAGSVSLGQLVFNGEGRVCIPVQKVSFRCAPVVEGASDAERLDAVNARLSPDLGVVISSHRADRIGSVDYRLTNVRHAEPPTELFTVPQDYTFVRRDDDPVIRFHPWQNRNP